MVSSFLRSQDYLKSVVPSQLIAERGSNLVVINPGTANSSLSLLFVFSFLFRIFQHLRSNFHWPNSILYTLIVASLSVKDLQILGLALHHRMLLLMFLIALLVIPTKSPREMFKIRFIIRFKTFTILSMLFLLTLTEILYFWGSDA